MFRKLISNLPFSPSLINQLSFYSKRLKKEQFTRQLGLLFTIIAIVVQTLTILAPAKATLAASGNDIIFGGGNKSEIQRVLGSGCDNRSRCDIRTIFSAYGINSSNLANATYENIYSSNANNYWSTGRAPRGYGGETSRQIPGGPVLYARTLSGWAVNRNWQSIRVNTAQGIRWILTDCGNIVTQEGQPAPKVPDLQVTKKVDNTAPLKGQFFNYSVTVSNIGKGTAQNVGARDEAPAGVNFISSSGGGTVKTPKLWVTSPAFNLAPGQSRSYTIRSQLISDGPARFDNTACALDTNGDSNGSNNCGTATILVRPACPLPGKANLPLDDKNCTSPGLKIEKIADKQDLKVGDTFTYTLQISNKGDVGLPRVVVRDVAPSEIEFSDVKEVGTSNFVAVGNKRDFVSKEFTLKKGSIVTITLRVKILASSPKPVVNQACVLSVGTGTTAGACNDTPVTIKEVCLTNALLPKDSKECQPPCEVPGKQNLPKNSPECKPCDETKQNQDDKDISCLELHKKARNITQQLANASSKLANAGDTIEYTLSVTNRAKQDRKAFIVEENMEDVLEYADLIDASGATFTENPIKMLSWAPITIKPNETINKTVLIKVKSSIPNTPASTSDPLSNDLKMINIYGDVVQIKLPGSPIKAVEQTVTSLPSTGLGTNIIISTILIMSATYFYFRSRLMVKELGLVRQQFNYGAGI